MRIVVYPHTLDIGGSQLNAIDLAAAVRDRGHDVFVFGERGPLISHIEALGLPFIDAPPFRRRPSKAIMSGLRELCRRERIDVVHAYEWPPCLEAYYGPYLADGVTTVFTILSMAVAPFLPSSAPLIVGAEQIAASAKDRHGPVRVVEVVIDANTDHPGFDGSAFREQWNLVSHPTVVIVSRLAVELKLEGLERAIGAAGILSDDMDLRLVIVGDGPSRDHLDQLAAAVNARTGRPTVTLTGEMSDPRAAYAAADVVLGMGTSALRGMAFGKPLVVLGEDGFAEILDPTTLDDFLWQGFYGLGDGDTSPDRLAEQIRTLLTDPARAAELGAYGRGLVETRFSTEAGAARLEELYKEFSARNVPRRTQLGEAAKVAGQVFTHKVRTKTKRLLGRSSMDDFNAKAKLPRIERGRV
jgi:glycosyltransferase involved in cell wall biosynthesis